MILYAVELALVLLLFFCQGATPINCYICSSLNGSNPHCEDPFNPAMSTYKEKCMVPKPGHIGMFPANFCIKIDGKNVQGSWEEWDCWWEGDTSFNIDHGVGDGNNCILACQELFRRAEIPSQQVETKEVMVIRACVMKTMDSQCGGFRYQDTMMTGCIQSCDYDGCNGAPASFGAAPVVAGLLPPLLVFLR